MQRSARPSPTALVSALLVAFSASAWSQASSFAAPQAQVAKAAPGQALARAYGASHASAVADAMRARGASDLTARSLVEIGGGQAKTGMTHVRLEQQVGGLTVYGSSVKSAFNQRGELVHQIEKVVPVPATAPKAAAISERQALDAAMAAVHPDARVLFPAGSRTGANSMRFAGGAFFHEAPQVTRVLVPQEDGTLAQGYLVQTWTQRGNLLDHTLVGGDGAVLAVERRTANDSYNVFAIDPGKSGQTLVDGPGAGSTVSPSGWLGTGTQTTYAINGNNVSTYLDGDANNAADSGGIAVSGGSFTTTADLAQAPTASVNKAVAVQNLFFLNNHIHDILYRHGFNEAAGNFQVSNFGKGGAGNDPVNAEAQDGSGTDNANFSTPTDGTRPRMQMYLWSGAGATHEVVVNGVSYGAMGAQFGPALTTTGVSGAIAVAVPAEGCTAISGVSGKVALIARGTCDFVTKVKNAQSAGATAVVISNNVSGIFAMGGTTKLRIPSVMISQADGGTLAAKAGQGAILRKKGTAPLQIDGDLDSDIVYHEYGHGLTWRMIGGMSGPLAGAIGEGASDVVAFMVNGDDRIGEYAYGNALGIRRQAYDNYSLKYADVTGAAVHNDGEIYAAAMWKLRKAWMASGRSDDALFATFVDGMNYTPTTPAFENMRNGMLASVDNSGASDANVQCALIWDAFAAFGIGDGAKGTVSRRGAVTILSSQAKRTDCSY
ncbi:MAG: M36 family metallopeptidase [Pseudomonadota bacterium]